MSGLGLAEMALDRVLAGVAYVAMGHDYGFAGAEPSRASAPKASGRIVKARIETAILLTVASRAKELGPVHGRLT
jgi:hypothetical protein